MEIADIQLKPEAKKVFIDEDEDDIFGDELEEDMFDQENIVELGLERSENYSKLRDTCVGM